MRIKITSLAVACALTFAGPVHAGSVPARAANGMVVCEEAIAAQVGIEAMQNGGNAIDAAVATAFALAVTLPTAGNIGGGGFLVYRPATGEPVAYDFREIAPAAATPDMWLNGGVYDPARHHQSHLAVGVPGTVAGLYLAWSENGKLPWERLVAPAIALASDGFEVTDGLARSLKKALPRLKKYPASVAQFTKGGTPYEAGEILKQPELAKTLKRIAEDGPAGFYEGETAELLVQEMQAGGGIITKDDLKGYVARKRQPIRGNYRGYEIISMPPPSSGGVTLVEMLNILEGYDLAGAGFGSARNIHRYVEAMRRAYEDRAQYLGDPDANPQMPIQKLTSKHYAKRLRNTIAESRASKSAPDKFDWRVQSPNTTHLSVVDSQRNAVALTYTLEQGYGSAIVVPGAGFLLNNEMGDFNPAPGLTNDEGLIGTDPNLTAPGKRMLSSMTPTIIAKDGQPFMVTGTPGGRTIINTVLQTILNVVDFGMNAQEAVDAGRIHHQWLPDEVWFERFSLSPDTVEILKGLGHTVVEKRWPSAAQVIVVDRDHRTLEGGFDKRVPDGAAVGY